MGDFYENFLADFSASREAGRKEAAMKRGIPEKYASMAENLVPTTEGTIVSVSGATLCVTCEYTTQDLDAILTDPQLKPEKGPLSLERWRELQFQIASRGDEWKLKPYWSPGIPSDYHFRDVEGELPVEHLVEITGTIQGDIKGKNWRDTYRSYLVEARYKGCRFTVRDGVRIPDEWYTSDGKGTSEHPGRMLAVNPTSSNERESLENARRWCLETTGKDLEYFIDK